MRLKASGLKQPTGRWNGRRNTYLRLWSKDAKMKRENDDGTTERPAEKDNTHSPAV